MIITTISVVKCRFCQALSILSFDIKKEKYKNLFNCKTVRSPKKKTK